MPFGMWTRVAQGNVLDGVQIRHGKGQFDGDDVGISPHIVNYRSDWPAAEAVECHIKFSQWKIPPAIRPPVKTFSPLVSVLTDFDFMCIVSWLLRVWLSVVNTTDCLEKLDSEMIRSVKLKVKPCIMHSQPVTCVLSINQSINLFVNLSLSQSNERVSKIHDRTPRKIQIFTYWCPPPSYIKKFLKQKKHIPYNANSNEK